MSAAEWLQIATLVVALVIGTRFLGAYMAKVYGDGPAPGDQVFGPDRATHLPDLSASTHDREQRWTVYASRPSRVQCRLGRSASTRCSGSRLSLPLATRTGSPEVDPALSFNTAVSFVTNTNWQSYSGESTMSYLTQMAGLAVQNFVSAAVGMAVAVALIRGLVRRRSATRSATSGSTSPARSCGSCCRSRSSSALFFVRQGVVQNFHGDHDGHDGRRAAADDPRRSGREPGGHQGARHQRRRLLQRQLGPPVREPERVHRLGRDLLSS